MVQRYALRDDQRARIEHLLPGRAGHVGGTVADNRRFVEALLYRYRAGLPWRDWPERSGRWKRVYQATVDALGDPTAFHLTGGQAHDLAGADALRSALVAGALTADRSYDAEGRVLAVLREVGAEAIIPPMRRRRVPHDCDRDRYAARAPIDIGVNVARKRL